jgi:hypothetical protein
MLSSYIVGGLVRSLSKLRLHLVDPTAPAVVIVEEGLGVEDLLDEDGISQGRAA